MSAFLAGALALGALGLGFLAGTDSNGVAAGLVDGATRVFFWGLILVVCARLAARTVGSRLTGLGHLVWDGAAGLAILIALLLAIGLVPGGYRAATVRGGLAALTALAALAAWTDPVSRFRVVDRTDGPTRGLVVLLLVLGVAGLAWDRVPPVFFDSRAYHFAQPELWLVTGRIAPETWSLHSWFPPGMSVLYGVGLATGGETWANDANLLVGLCLLAGAFDLGRRLFGAWAGLLAGAVLTGLPLTLYAIAIPAADLGHGLFVFGSLASLLLLRSTGHPCWLTRAALLAAGAVLTKYLGLIVPLGLGAVWVGAWPSSAGVRPVLRARLGMVLRFAAPAVLLALPWFASNSVAVGNPIAPAASSVFSTRGLAPGGAESFRVDARGGPPGWDDLLSLAPRWLTGSEEESRIYPTPAWGWLPIFLAPFALLAARDERNVRVVMGLSLVLLFFWFATFRWERFLVAAAALLSVALAGGVVVTWRRVGALRALSLAAFVVGAASVVPALVAIERFTGAARVAGGLESPREFIERALPIARLFHRANERLDPRADRVLIVGEMRHYGLSLPRCAPTGFNTHPLVEVLRADPDPEAANRALRRSGFTHLIVDPGWIDRSGARYPSLAHLAEHPEVVQRYLGSLGAPLVIERNVVLFRIPG